MAKQANTTNAPSVPGSVKKLTPPRDGVSFNAFAASLAEVILKASGDLATLSASYKETVETARDTLDTGKGGVRSSVFAFITSQRLNGPVTLEAWKDTIAPVIVKALTAKGLTEKSASVFLSDAKTMTLAASAGIVRLSGEGIQTYVERAREGLKYKADETAAIAKGQTPGQASATARNKAGERAKVAKDRAAEREVAKAAKGSATPAGGKVAMAGTFGGIAVSMATWAQANPKPAFYLLQVAEERPAELVQFIATMLKALKKEDKSAWDALPDLD